VKQVPLVSCLCISRRRPHLLARSVRCFLAQTHANTELVVVHPASDEGTRACLESFRSPRIRAHAVDATMSLGELRNFSIEHASGDFLCTWDDDDWHSPARLEQQLAAAMLSFKPAVLCSRLFMFDSIRRIGFLGYERLWENTVFFARSRILELGLRYPALDRHEDYEFVNSLIRENLVYVINDPTLYIYQVNGTNTSAAPHLQALEKRSAPLSGHQTDLLERAVTESISPAEALRQMQTDEFRASLQYVRPSAVPRH
jgi:glycosyltransferase involved in cell wall biosynthesis